MRYLPALSLVEIDRMTFLEYRLRMKAHALRQVDEEHHIHRQAWALRRVNTKEKKGKNKLAYVYKSMKEFFDFKAMEDEVMYGESPKETPKSSVSQRLIEYRRRKKDGQL